MCDDSENNKEKELTEAAGSPAAPASQEQGATAAAAETGAGAASAGAAASAPASPDASSGITAGQDQSPEPDQEQNHSNGNDSSSGGSGSGFSEQRPQQVYIIPNSGRPVMPSQIAPMQISTDWEDIILNVIKSDSKVFAMFSLGDEPVSGKNLKESDFPRTGTLVRLLQVKNTPTELHLFCEGLCRVRITRWLNYPSEPAALVEYPATEMPVPDSREDVQVKAYAMNLVASIQELLPLNPLYTEEMRQYLMRFDQNDPSMLADCAAAITTCATRELQHVLDTLNLFKRIKMSSALIKKELKAARLQDKIKNTVMDKLSKRQKEFFLREQLSEIQKELGTKMDDRSADAVEFQKRMKKLLAPPAIQDRFESELKKLQVLESGSPEYAVTRNYLDVLTTIPWGKTAKEDLDLTRAREILDKDHEGLSDVKDRILEFMAIGALKGSTKGSIILFVGPPGTGKTSIGKSIARALNRPFFRLSLGGVDDESVIKGHRKTYIGSMPGKMVQALRESGVMNPVIMLDEVDKLSRSYQGDPAAALLEALDPEQNNSFLDHYLDEKLDLSNCLFICTANTTEGMPAALLDRMDPIRLSGYIAEEKFRIAKKHLLPRGLKKAGMKKSQLKISDKVLRKLIEGYARESGVRSLERSIEKLIRKAAVRLVKGEVKSLTVREDQLEAFLGPPPFKKERSISGCGVITGLAWTSSGGATLSIESLKIHSEERGFRLTGQLGDVMKESAQIAYSYIEANLARLAPAQQDFFRKAYIHLHVPEGATPKDGPSAGVTMASSLLSLALGEPPRPGFAMTGELSLTGQVLAIGGLREKTIAARRMGIFNIICPRANESDLAELPYDVKNRVNYYFAENYDDVAKVIFPSVASRLGEGPAPFCAPEEPPQPGSGAEESEKPRKKRART